MLLDLKKWLIILITNIYYPMRSLPFKTNTSLIPTPWNSQTHLLSVAIKGAQQDMPKSLAKNLVFLVDVSGSMRDPEEITFS